MIHEPAMYSTFQHCFKIHFRSSSFKFTAITYNPSTSLKKQQQIIVFIKQHNSHKITQTPIQLEINSNFQYEETTALMNQ